MSFTSILSHPAKFYTDRGTQLSKAGSFIDSKENPANWTWDKVKDTLASKKFKSTIVFLVASGKMEQLNNEFEP